MSDLLHQPLSLTRAQLRERALSPVELMKATLTRIDDVNAKLGPGNPLAKVRQCTNPECGLYFVDESPNQSRRWCSRSRCGLRGGFERRRRSRPTPLVGEG